MGYGLQVEGRDVSSTIMLKSMYISQSVLDTRTKRDITLKLSDLDEDFSNFLLKRIIYIGCREPGSYYIGSYSYNLQRVYYTYTGTHIRLSLNRISDNYFICSFSENRFNGLSDNLWLIEVIGNSAYGVSVEGNKIPSFRYGSFRFSFIYKCTPNNLKNRNYSSSISGSVISVVNRDRNVENTSTILNYGIPFKRDGNYPNDFVCNSTIYGFDYDYDDSEYGLESGKYNEVLAPLSCTGYQVSSTVLSDKIPLAFNYGVGNWYSVKVALGKNGVSKFRNSEEFSPDRSFDNGVNSYLWVDKPTPRQIELLRKKGMIYNF